MLHDICISKTGTITTGTMSVAKFHLFNWDKTIVNEKRRDPAFFNND